MKKELASNQIPGRAQLSNLSVFGATPEECQAASLLLSELYPDRINDEHAESWSSLRWQQEHSDEIARSPEGKKIEAWIAALPEEISITTIGSPDLELGIITEPSTAVAPDAVPPSAPGPMAEAEGVSMKLLRSGVQQGPEIRVPPKPLQAQDEAGRDWLY